MKKVLITGEPVHAHLDAVKIITNRFKGGLMVELAEEILGDNSDYHVTYLCAPKAGAVTPRMPRERLQVVEHNGFDDYKSKVLELAPQMDAVVLGAAVANLIPAKPWKGKFPSHDYKVGDIIPIDFTIAPRVIDEVKKVAPRTHLFGFKLLSDVPHEELISAAYGIVLEAKTTAVIANDYKKGLDNVHVVTKERGVHPMRRGRLAFWIPEMLADQYFRTVSEPDTVEAPFGALTRARALIEQYHNKFVSVETGLIFGTVAVRDGGGFVTTGRGKHELDSLAYVTRVDHVKRVVYSAGGKASLNAPLLAEMFENPLVDYVVHYHEQVAGLPTEGYAPPGTARDTYRDNRTSFNIKEHGCMLLFDKEGRQL